ncbi:4Fe-4S dicluster domain-containing protein [Nocardioides panacisoli]|uniref:heterodisulfide reductase-related iron-sulfur binding cluster n=1 Tax=Nocardioides panacisoli TaxID=627624 RepID=UPI001C636BAD|nr:heterodisulfide reductase-related iron-sulfur binding cluster [Nocardioides panacisoli]QYJ02963.1 4Fe-4S dicluster domain-containing protein [Nocardioides panacisoli]
MLQIFAIVVSFALTAVAVVLTANAVTSMLGVIRVGQPARRTDQPVQRTLTMLKETFLHTRMLQWTWVGIMHWFVYAAFLFLSTAVLGAYFQLFDPEWVWPVFGHWYPYEWFAEFIGLLSSIGIIFLIIYRQKHHPRTEGRDSRFYGSTQWQAYFVEYLALLEGGAILFIRAAEYNLGVAEGHTDVATRAHFPLASWLAEIYPSSAGANEQIIYFIAMFKIALAMVWLMVIARNLTMGIAWHRFTAWFNIWFKREGDGGTALGAVKPMMMNGEPVGLDDLEEMDEDSTLGAGSIQDFSWKGILDFTTCTECGRCQSQCPAWNTEKPLSPKLLMMGLREHAYANAGGDGEKALVGKAGDNTEDVAWSDWFYNPEDGDFVIDEDVLWSCTNCGACVQQCPVDIEHVDHIIDMRRYQTLVESNFPSELNGLFKGMENKGNPWNMSASARLDWTQGLDVDVKVVGKDIESLDEVDWLFWVGCAGAYEDRAKKTTRAVAELLDMAGVSFGVLGNGETCTGDAARRAGNEFVYQGLAQQNVETFKEYKVKKVVSTCAHCFNTLRNEYKDLGVELEVVHHTQLLNQLVREGKLTPVADGAGAHQRSITYHDPCFIGRHNQVYEPPRELLQIMPGAEYKEMERSGERSFCCGAGGARMWMEEKLGSRINLNRTDEAVGTGADQIAVGCPFCRVMLSDGLTKMQADGGAREEVEVLDVAQMLLASVKGTQATKLAPGEGAPAGAAVATEEKAEPEAGDATITEDTVTDTEDVGANAKASGGTSMFDDPSSMFDDADAEPASTPAPSSGGSLFDTPAEEPAGDTASAPEKSGGEDGSLFDEGGSLFDTPAESTQAKAEPADATAEPEDKAPEKPAEPEADLGSGGSLFDVAPTQEAEKPAPAEPAADTASAEPAAAEKAPEAEKPAEPAAEESPAPATEIGSGSLFDIEAPEPAPAAKAPEPEPEPASEPAAEEQDTGQDTAPTEEPTASAASAPAEPATEIGSGSLFDIEAPEPAPAAKAPEPEPEAKSPEPEESKEPAQDEAAQDDESGDAPDETEQVESEEEPEQEKPAPKSSGPAHQPRTDADISGSDSLFDL